MANISPAHSGPPTPSSQKLQSNPDLSKLQSDLVQHTSSDRKATNSKKSNLRKRLRLCSQDANLSKGYRDIFNEAISDIAANSHLQSFNACPTSSIKGSLWTLPEKEALLYQLSRFGPNNLAAIQTGVKSKTIPEIVTYLSTLRDGIAESTLKLSARDLFRLENVPAAIEISPACEKELDLAANALAHYVAAHDLSEEEKLHRELFLIDENIACDIEQSGHESQHHLQLSDANSDDASAQPQFIDEIPDASRSTNAATSRLEALPTEFQLLSPGAMLRLSRTLFMNSSSPGSDNWHNLTQSESDGDFTGPAIYRTAFEDLYNLVNSFTRRLVQSSMFQALTRLRARDEFDPVSTVRAVDVQTALNILGLKFDNKRYWATAARRCEVQVYTDSRKYSDNRQQTHLGFKISYDEVEAELGFQPQKPSTAAPMYDEEPSVIIDSILEDSEQWTSEAESENNIYHNRFEGGLHRFNSQEKDKDVDEPATRRKRSVSIDDDNYDAYLDSRGRKRYRQISPNTRNRVEDKYLEGLDHANSLEEEERLLTRIGKEHDLSSPRTSNLTKQMVPEVRDSNNLPVWQEICKYEADWECNSGGVHSDNFIAMETRGKQMSRIRQSAVAHLRARGVSELNLVDEETDYEVE